MTKLNSVFAYKSCIWASVNAGPANEEVAAVDNANYTPLIALRGFLKLKSRKMKQICLLRIGIELMLHPRQSFLLKGKSSLVGRWGVCFGW